MLRFREFAAVVCDLSIDVAHGVWAHNLVLRNLQQCPKKTKSLCLCVPSLIFLVSMVVYIGSGVYSGVRDDRNA